jgi:hypothetical protein
MSELNEVINKISKALQISIDAQVGIVLTASQAAVLAGYIREEGLFRSQFSALEAEKDMLSENYRKIASENIDLRARIGILETKNAELRQKLFLKIIAKAEFQKQEVQK